LTNPRQSNAAIRLQGGEGGGAHGCGAMETLNAWGQHLAGDCGLDPRSVTYHRKL